MPHIYNVFQFLATTFVLRKLVDKVLLCVFAEVVEDRAIAEANCGQIASKVDLDLSDLFSDLV